MHRTLKKLYRDHAHINRLMNALELQLNKIKNTDQPSFPLIAEIISYLGDYADTFHHPVEDQLYQILLAHSDQGRESMEKLLGEHMITMNLTREFKRALEALSKSSVISRDRVEKIGREYVEHQRSHMEFEEGEAFPFLRKELSDAAFDEAAGAIPAIEDPLLDPNMKSHYPLLLEYLAQEKDEA